jgi:hypothetical protein
MDVGDGRAGEIELAQVFGYGLIAIGLLLIALVLILATRMILSRDKEITRREYRPQYRDAATRPFPIFWGDPGDD